jgi:hypothetical protein
MAESGATPRNLWGFATVFGYCVVEIRSLLSDAAAGGGVFAPGNRTLDQLRGDPLFVQLFALFRAGLVPLSMAGDLGELERRAACELPRRGFGWAVEPPRVQQQRRRRRG